MLLQLFSAKNAIGIDCCDSIDDLFSDCIDTVQLMEMYIYNNEQLKMQIAMIVVRHAV